MKSFIQHKLRETLLKEEMRSAINQWQQNLSFEKNGIYNLMLTTIARDDKNDNRLYLFVGLTEIVDRGYYNYSYSFMLTDNENKPLTDYMTERAEVAKYLPKELIKTRQIFPIIKELTRKLLQKMTPEEIRRKMVEPLSGESTIRYDEITKIMVDEFGYKDVSSLDLRKMGMWRLVKVENNKKNSTLKEEYVLGYEEELEKYKQSIKEMTYAGVKALQNGTTKKIYDNNGKELI